nr:retrovirus-related Pol polyprotein from transposon TNT 1-94 [Tanacetum cinerariifolium]
MGRDTVQLETAVNTISHEYLLEFTSEYGIPETLHPVLPGPKDRIVDFPEGKIEFTSEYGIPETLHPVLPGPKDRIVDFPEGKIGVYTRYGLVQFDPYLKSYKGEDSSGVPSTIERSPLDFAHEAGASEQGVTASKLPLSEDVLATVASGAGQAVISESEYVAVSGYCAQVLWMRTQLTDYGFFYDKVPIYCDLKSAIAISCNPVQHTRTKHIDVRYHFIKDHV